MDFCVHHFQSNQFVDSKWILMENNPMPMNNKLATPLISGKIPNPQRCSMVPEGSGFLGCDVRLEHHWVEDQNK